MEKSFAVVYMKKYNHAKQKHFISTADRPDL
jgi:hypothetical protein